MGSKSETEKRDSKEVILKDEIANAFTFFKHFQLLTTDVFFLVCHTDDGLWLLQRLHKRLRVRAVWTKIGGN